MCVNNYVCVQFWNYKININWQIVTFLFIFITCSLCICHQNKDRKRHETCLAEAKFFRSCTAPSRNTPPSYLKTMVWGEKHASGTSCADPPQFDHQWRCGKHGCTCMNVWTFWRAANMCECLRYPTSHQHGWKVNQKYTWPPGVVDRLLVLGISDRKINHTP